MPLEAQINQDLDNALRNQDQATLATLRLLKNSLKNHQIDKPGELSDQDVVKVLQKEAKQRRDSIDSYQQANRQDLVDKEQQELSIIETYLPKQMGEAELAQLVQAAIKEAGAVGPQDMGKVMKLLAPKTAGKADGSKVAQLVKDKLQS